MTKLKIKHAICLAIITLATISGLYATTLEFSEIKGKNTESFTWNIAAQGKNTLLAFSRKDQTYATTTNADLHVLRWHFTQASTHTDFLAVREKNTISIGGTFNNKPITQTIRIDGDPWYQPLSYSLKNFILSNDQQSTYWTINPSTLNAYKMKARKIKVETITYGNQTVKTQKVKVSLTGPKSAFWHAHYWFRLSDGLFLQYQGVDGPPGTPETFTRLATYIP